MKKLLTLFFLLGIINVYGQWTLETIGDWDANGKPDYLHSVNDNVTITDINRITGGSGYIPAGQDVTLSHPEYIQKTDIRIHAADSIYITFVTESAGNKNSLGYYSYNDNNIPASKNDISTVTLIFPNSSNNNTDDLTPGNRVNLGYFPAGTTIGWVLFSNSWKTDSTIFVNGLPNFSNTYYSDQSFNPGQRAHTILFKDTVSNRWVLGFEDLDLGDKDYSDMLYYISGHTTNPTSSLPVELLGVDFNKHTRILTWETASELNNNYFTLNYLDTDGVKVSTEQIDGKGNSSIVSTYAVNVASNVAYVEIWQTDFDGKSKQIAKQYVGISVADHIKLYPNPSNGPTTISGDFSEIEVFDANGAQMSFQLIDNEISGLKTGFYYVVFDNIIVKKLIVF